MNAKRIIIGGLMVFLAPLALLISCLGVGFIAAQTAYACSPPSSDTGGPTAAETASLFQAIKIDSAGDNRLLFAMLVGSNLESNWVNTAVGNGSYGPWQIQNPGMSPGPHPDITVTQAMDPAYSTNYMAPDYRSALRRVDPAKWASNPEGAAEETAYRAERPTDDYYVVRGIARVHLAYTASLDAMKTLGVSTDFIGTTIAPLSTSTASLTAAATAVPTPCNPYTNVGSGSAKVVLQAAEKWLGTPYVYGGGGYSGPSKSALANGNFNDVGFDCSGLTMYAYHQAGIDLPHSSEQQWLGNQVHSVPLGHEQPGDLIFFEPSASGPGHVGIVVDPGKGIMINAPRTGKPVQYSEYRNWGTIVGIVHLLSNSPATSTATATATATL